MFPHLVEGCLVDGALRRHHDRGIPQQIAPDERVPGSGSVLLCSQLSGELDRAPRRQPCLEHRPRRRELPGPAGEHRDRRAREQCRPRQPRQRCQPGGRPAWLALILPPARQPRGEHRQHHQRAGQATGEMRRRVHPRQERDRGVEDQVLGDDAAALARHRRRQGRSWTQDQHGLCAEESPERTRGADREPLQREGRGQSTGERGQLHVLNLAGPPAWSAGGRFDRA